MDERVEKRPEWAQLPAREVSADLGYALWAPVYDAGAGVLAAEEAAVERHLAGLEPTMVLDAATGTGRHLERLSARAERVVGLDRSPEMLARAAQKRLGSDVTLLLGTFERLPFDARRFDLVVCALALCHIEDLSAPLAEFRRVIGPRSRLLLTDFHPDAVRWGLRSEFRRDGDFVRLPNPQRDIDAYLAAVERAGFALQAVESITQGDVGLAPSRDLAPEFHDEWSALNFFLVASAAAA